MALIHLATFAKLTKKRYRMLPTSSKLVSDRLSHPSLPLPPPTTARCICPCHSHTSYGRAVIKSEDSLPNCKVLLILRCTSFFKSETFEFFYLTAYYTYSCRGCRYYHIRYSQEQTHPTEKSWVARPQVTVDSASGNRSPRLLRKEIVKPLREIRRMYDECLFGRQLFRHGAL